jgi:hypothetical protein
MDFVNNNHSTNLCHVVLISFILIFENQLTNMFIYLYLTTISEKHVHCDTVDNVLTDHSRDCQKVVS